MTKTQLLKKTCFLTDSKGRKTAVQIDISTWEELLAMLEKLSTRKAVKRTKRAIRIASPRLKHREQAADFKMTMAIEG